MDDHFRNLRLVFDTTFCGDWAGNTWNQTSCGQLAPTCEEYVSKNPQAFGEAYWAVNTLQVFQDDGKGDGNGAVGGKSGSGNGTVSDVDANIPDLGGNGPVKAKAVIQKYPVNTGTGTFIKSAALVHPAIADAQVDGWAPREGRGGSVLSRRR